jgi:AcrR family transcriptional regulator
MANRLLADRSTVNQGVGFPVVTRDTAALGSIGAPRAHAIRMQPQQRRAAILDAAIAEIAERGFARTTSRHVAARAGVTHGLLHHYFPDHDTLLAAAFERVALEEIAEAEEFLAADRDPIAQLQQLIEPYGPGGGEDAYRMWFEAWAEAAHSPALRSITAKVSKAWLDMVIAVIERGNAQGVFHCVDPHATAWMLVALCDAYALHSQIGPTVDGARMAEVQRRYAERDMGLAPGALDPAPRLP